MHRARGTPFHLPLLTTEILKLALIEHVRNFSHEITSQTKSPDRHYVVTHKLTNTELNGIKQALHYKREGFSSYYINIDTNTDRDLAGRLNVALYDN